MIPLVAARCFGSGPSTVPNVRTWSFSKSQVLPWACAYSMACWSLAASMPSSAGDFFCHCPRAGKVVAVFLPGSQGGKKAPSHGRANKPKFKEKGSFLPRLFFLFLPPPPPLFIPPHPFVFFSAH